MPLAVSPPKGKLQFEISGYTTIPATEIMLMEDTPPSGHF